MTRFPASFPTRYSSLPGGFAAADLLCVTFRAKLWHLPQLVDLNFDQSYMTKSNQKPLYKTRYMLDNVLTN